MIGVGMPDPTPPTELDRSSDQARDAAERLRLRRERQFADAQALAKVGSWARDLDTGVSLWSEEMCRIFGQPADHAPSFEDVIALVHPEDREHVRRDLIRAREGALVETAYRIVRPGGEIRHVIGRTYGRAEHGDRIDYVYGTIQDVTDRRVAETAHRDAQQLFEKAFSEAPIGMALVGLDGRWMKVNAALCRITGYGEDELLSLSYLDLLHPEDPAGPEHVQVQRLLAGEISSYQAEKRYLTRGGGTIWILLSASLVRDVAGDARYYVAQISDITQRKEAEDRLQRAEAEARAERDHATAIIEAMSEGYALTCDGEIVAVNDALCQLTGFTAEQLIGSRAPFPFWPADLAEALTHEQADFRAEAGGSRAATFVRADGERFEAEVTARPARFQDGRPLGFVNTIRDVSAQRRYERELERLARTDTLTGLANRLVLQESLEREAPRRPDPERGLALVLLDIDNFKQVNDAYGHPAGDAVLREVAWRLQRTVRAGEVIARVGGEEFAWLIPGSTAEEATAAADRGRAAIAAEPVGRAGILTMSAGVAIVSTPCDGDRLYRMADRALYAAKQGGRDRTCLQSDGSPAPLLAGV